MNKTVKKLIAFVLIVCAFATSMSSCSGLPFAPKLSSKVSWLKNANADTVVKVLIDENAYGMAPGSIFSSYYSEDKEVIEKIITYFCNIRVSRDYSGRVYQIDGGSGRTVTVTFADRGTKSLLFKHGYFIDGNKVYKTYTSENIRDYYSEFNRYFRFNTYKNTGSVYTNTEDAICVGEAEKIGSWHFIYLSEMDDEDDYLQATHYIEVSFGKIYILSETRFCVKFYNEIEYYELIDGQSFIGFITPKV